MIQDIQPFKYNNQYEEQKPDDDAYIFLQKDGQLLIKKEEERLIFPTLSDLGKERVRATYLFSIDENKFFLADEGEKVPEELYEKGYSFVSAWVMRKAEPKWMSFAGICAFQLAGWYSSNKFCGRCGQKLEEDHKERMLRCPECGNVIYPKISPAVIVAITNGDKILLTKYSGRPNNTRYALIAGFTEIGETIEETVRREVMEEVGLKVKNLRYYKSQPWSFSDTLLMGFFCQVDGDDTITLDKTELSVGEWVAREDMKVDDDDFSLTYEMMGIFKHNKFVW